MKNFWTDGGDHRPWFRYRIKVDKVTNEMWKWCEQYDDGGHYFRRFHVEWDNIGMNKGFDIIQFEWEEAAIMFALTFNIKN